MPIDRLANYAFSPIVTTHWADRFAFRNRWVVTTTLLAATTLNFLDRQALSVLAPVLEEEIGLTSMGYSTVVNSFLVVYSVMYLVAGRIVDWLGTRRGLGLAIIWWSIAQMLHGATTGMVSLCLVRALLAIGEAAVVPSAVKAVAEWFEAKERGLAISIWEAGLALGPMLAPPVVVWISFYQGWRAAFFYTGGVGFILAALWLLSYRTPASADREDSVTTGPSSLPAPVWRELFTSRAIWGVGITRVFGDPIWFFYLFWLPKYLSEAKDLTLSDIGAFAWIPYFFQMLGGFAGGAAASWLIRRGTTPIQARLKVMLWSSVVVSSGVLSVLSNSLFVVMLTVSVGAFALQVWGINVETLPSDIFPPNRVASAVGLCGLLGTTGAAVFTMITGYVVENFSYTPIWIASATMYPSGWLLGWLLLRSTINSEKSETN